MNATLNLVDHLLATGRRYQEMGRHRDALTLFTRLSGFRELPAEAAEETQVRLAELHLRRRRYERARRHLAAALRHQPDSARYHFLMATAQRAADKGDLGRADEHYRRSLELDPEQPRCLCDGGLLDLRLGRTEEGLARLRRAVELAPDNADVLGKLVKGLLLAGRADEACSALRAARFRNPRSARIGKLWADFQFQQLRRQREADRLEEEGAAAEADGPVLLPFVRLHREAPTGENCPTILRHDEASPLAPHLPRVKRRADQRYVQ